MKIKIILWISALSFMFACGTIGTPTQAIPKEPGIETQAVLPSFTPIPTFTQVPPTEKPFAQPIEVRISEFNETNDAPAFTVKAQIPSLHNSDDPNISVFNSLMNQTIMDSVNQFRNDVLSFPSDLPVSAGSFFDAQFSVIGQQGDFWSVKFDVGTYYAGAAHPGPLQYYFEL